MHSMLQDQSRLYSKISRNNELIFFMFCLIRIPKYHTHTAQCIQFKKLYSLNNTTIEKKEIFTAIQKLGLIRFNVFGRSLICSPRLHLFDTVKTVMLRNFITF